MRLDEVDAGAAESVDTGASAVNRRVTEEIQMFPARRPAGTVLRTQPTPNSVRVGRPSRSVTTMGTRLASSVASAWRIAADVRELEMPSLRSRR